MKYFMDCEFLEGTQSTKWLILKGRLSNALIGTNKPTIDLISIGIISEDNREYYAISKDFDLKEAWNRFQLEEQSGDMRNVFPEGKKVYWIRNNVLKSIYEELFKRWMLEIDSLTGDEYVYFNYSNLKELINKYGKTNKEIAEEIKNFVYIENKDKGGQLILGSFIPNIYPKIEFYGYYCDYYWVVFCWLFGKMIDLPKGFPKFCFDLKQELDNKVKNFCKLEIESTSFKSAIERIKNHSNYPKQNNEHNALEDSRWNKELYNFLNNL